MGWEVLLEKAKRWLLFEGSSSHGVTSTWKPCSHAEKGQNHPFWMDIVRVIMRSPNWKISWLTMKLSVSHQTPQFGRSSGTTAFSKIYALELFCRKAGASSSNPETGSEGHTLSNWPNLNLGSHLSFKFEHFYMAASHWIRSDRGSAHREAFQGACK